MIIIHFLTVELVFTAIWLLVRIAVWIRNRRIDWKREAMLLLMYVNLAVIIRYVIFPMEIVNKGVQPLFIMPEAVFPLRINWIPFVNIMKYETKSDMLLNTIGNVVLFIPTGIILPILYKRLNSFWKVTLTGFLISLSIEILQLPLVSRLSDVDDLILNTLGVMIGFGVYALVKRMTVNAPSATGSSPSPRGR